jgi:hypothetical protein
MITNKNAERVLLSATQDGKTMENELEVVEGMRYD